MTKHFNKNTDKKITCSCCGTGDLVPEMYAVLELVRRHFGKPVNISSGYRCEKYNASKKVGGGKNSQHLLGTAADIWISGVSPIEIYNYLDSIFPNTYGLGLYIEKGFVHCDCRIIKGRW